MRLTVPVSLFVFAASAWADGTLLILPIGTGTIIMSGCK